MNIRTIEDDFEYQVKNVLSDLVEEYKNDMNDNRENNEPIITYSEWLWDNKDQLGEAFYTRVDEYLGIDQFTEHHNVPF